MRNNQPRRSCADDRQSVVVERNRFFTGKYMTARDFTAEQDYLVARHRLHNRLLHGWGVVCGLGVTGHPDPGCADHVVVGSGVAIDCHGRDLILTRRVPVRVPCPPAGAPEGERRFLLCAAYCEEEVEPVPVVHDDCGCATHRGEANRVREGVTLTVRPFDDVDPACWAVPGGGSTRYHDDCDGTLPTAQGGCLEPDCPCGGLVPLAAVIVADDGSLEIDASGRRTLPVAPTLLTTITATSWVHGGGVSLRELRADPRLWIRFDRAIAAAEGIATGINPETLVVQHAGEGDDLEYVPYDTAHPPCLEDEHHAVFTVDPGFLDRGRRGGLAGSTVYITLLADFVLDCHGRAVDGDHVGGRLPSGNGIPGGVFRSWFTVEDDRPDHYGPAPKEA